MKKALISLTAIALPAFAPLAHAADGTINFTGELMAQTCTIDVNGTVTPAVATVTLPTVSTGKLTASGETTGQTGFVVGLKNCSGPATAASAFFENGPTVDLASGNLNTTAGAGAATNVQLQLVDASNGSTIKAGNTDQNTNTTRIALDASGNANLPYAVQYYATGATTAGSVNSSVTYSINYQ
ncbi:type 1 fimbrial protein [Burkholderia stabilis]|uniref:Type 1 fimbrial protein n=1 Tax=Burkholderia stabilis TaxID=95485 RepID=A0A4Q2AIV4_9BURK|nr:fimbrial protein [Burkholderia stabilis]RXV68731.1 type 1 fimbrial protein [Burkholderia stabilis]